MTSAVWPGKEQFGPYEKGEKTEYIYKARTPPPCYKLLKASWAAKNPETAIREARYRLSVRIKDHVKTCKKCQANGVKP